MISSIIGGVGNVFGSIMGYKGQKSANKTNMAIADQTNQTNIQLANQAREHDVDMWNRQNEYNTPQMQMQRLQEAGLNPNLIYDSSGAGATGNAGAPQKAPVAHAERAQVANEMASIAALNMAPLIGLYQDWEVKKAQIDNIKAQTENQISQNVGNQLRNFFLEQDKPWAKLMSQLKYQDASYRAESANYKRLQDMYDYELRGKTLSEELESRKNKFNIAKHQLEGQSLMNRQRKLEIALDEQLKPFGMHKGDELWQRILLPVVLENINPRSILKMFKR